MGFPMGTTPSERPEERLQALDSLPHEKPVMARGELPERASNSGIRRAVVIALLQALSVAGELPHCHAEADPFSRGAPSAPTELLLSDPVAAHGSTVCAACILHGLFEPRRMCFSFRARDPPRGGSRCDGPADTLVRGLVQLPEEPRMKTHIKRPTVARVVLPLLVLALLCGVEVVAQPATGQTKAGRHCPGVGARAGGSRDRAAPTRGAGPEGSSLMKRVLAAGATGYLGGLRVAVHSMPAMYQIGRLVRCEGDNFETFKKFNGGHVPRPGPGENLENRRDRERREQATHQCHLMCDVGDVLGPRLSELGSWDAIPIWWPTL